MVLIQILPGLQSFCISCAIAIGAVFILQSSWFVAWLTLDEKRIEGKRNGFFPWIAHPKWTAPPWTQKDYGKMMMGQVAKMFKLWPVQVSARAYWVLQK